MQMTEGLQTTAPEGLPQAFLDRMKGLLPGKEYEAFLSSYGRERLFSLRINPLKCSRGRFLSLLREEGADVPDEEEPGRAQAGDGTLPELADVEEEPGQAEAGDTRTGDERPGEAQIRREAGRGSRAGAAVNTSGFLRPVPWEPDGFFYPEKLRPGRHPRHEAGMYYIQEASAMAPAVLCGARPGERILDLCAAPGGKSTKLAASLQGKGLLVANEIHPGRAKILSANLERMGVRNALVTSETPQQLASRFPLFFDRIVVDAPCSGEGMFRKEEQALIHWSLENVQMCAQRQQEILNEAAGMLRPGGMLVYSTCTFSPEENEGTIFRFLMDHPAFFVENIHESHGGSFFCEGFSCGRPEWLPAAGIDPSAEEDPERAQNAADSLRGTVRLWPHLVEGEGHFIAVLKKRDRDGLRAAYPGEEECAGRSTEDRRETEPQRDRQYREDRRGSKSHPAEPGTPGRGGKGRGGKKTGGKGENTIDRGRKEVLHAWEEFCRENLLLPDGMPAPGILGEDRLLLFGKTLYGLPVPVRELPVDGLRVLRAGLQLGTLEKGRFTPSHSLGMAVSPKEAVRTLEIPGDSREARAWIRGESLPVDAGRENGWTLVLIDGCAAGWGKVSGGMLKNHYPRGLRRANWI